MSFAYYDPQKPHRGPKGFRNNYDNSPHESIWRWLWERITKPYPKRPYLPELVTPERDWLTQNRVQDSLTWFGHSSSMVQLEGKNILLDPIFSQRASPFSWAGPKRHTSNPLTIEELPLIDIVVISHNHYDHLDLPTLKALKARFPDIQVLVPLGDEILLRKHGFKYVHAFDWWDSLTIEGLVFTFVPSQHWSQRTIFKPNQSLWGGFHIRSPKRSLIYVGDTGYSKDFSDIYERLGPVDIALIPIGAYEPRWFMRRQHVNPDEALKIHHDLKSKRSFGVHWGTFKLTDENLMEPPELLARLIEENPLTDSSFETLQHGQTIRF